MKLTAQEAIDYLNEEDGRRVTIELPTHGGWITSPLFSLDVERLKVAEQRGYRILKGEH